MQEIGSALMEKEGKYLLVKARHGAAKGLWNNPGGHQEEGETLEETVKREVKEETGFDAGIGRLIGVYFYEDIRKSVYEVHISGEKGNYSLEEIEEARWFSFEEVNNIENITFGAQTSIRDYRNKKFNREYHPKKIP